MSCDTIRDANANAIGIACSRGRRGKRCKQCGAHATKQCDFALTGRAQGRTCDVYLCDRCAVRQPGRAVDGDSIDYCPPHARFAAKPLEQLVLGTKGNP